MSEYADRDIVAQGEHYTRHVSAMTEEGLHSKSDIAAELAHRDIVNEQLRKDKAELVDGLERVVAIVNSDAAKSYYGARGAFGDVEAVARSLINKNGVSHE